MYITPDLFLGQTTAPEYYGPGISCGMVGFANMLGKRKRMEDERRDSTSPYKDRVSLSTIPSWTDPVAMKLALPESYGPAGVYSYHFDSSAPVRSSKSEEPPAQKRRIAASRRSTAPISKAQPRSQNITPVLPLGPNSMEPCHRCHRIPRQKKDLQGYIYCERPECSSRTCSVCTRECGCGRRICSSPGCSVEYGAEGTIYCVECFVKRADNQSLDREQEMSG